MPEIDQVEELDFQLVKSRSIKGVASLISRSVLVQLISSVGFFLLTVFLGRSDIGIFIAVTEIVAILGYFSDIGLAAALIQKKDPPDISDLRTTFTLQQVLVFTLTTFVLIISPFLSKFYHLEGRSMYLLFALLFGFILASLKTIPSILLERALSFDKLAIVEVVETLIFYGVAVFLAFNKFGIASYTFAVIGRGVVGTTILYILMPWPIGLSFSRQSLKELLKFGLPYQVNTFLAVIKDRFTNLILFRMIGAEGIGILGWAQTWAQKPLRFIMDNVTKVSFPALSRLQNDPAALKKALEKSLFYSTSIIFPILIGFGLLARPLISLIPRYTKWEIALVPLYLFLFSSAWAAISTPLTNALNAIGKIRYTFYLMIMWTTVTLILVPVFALKYGYLGVTYATAIIALTSVVPIIITHRFVPFNLVDSIAKPLMASIVMGIAVRMSTSFTSPTASFISGIAVGIIVYPVALVVICGQKIIPEIQALFRQVIPHQSWSDRKH